MSSQRSVMNVFVGVLSVLVGHAIALVIIYLFALAITTILPTFYWLMSACLYTMFGIGITQLLYVIPLCLWLRERERFDTMKGVIIGAVPTLLLNGSCFALFTMTFSY